MGQLKLGPLDADSSGRLHDPHVPNQETVMDHDGMLDALARPRRSMGVISPRPFTRIDPLYGTIEAGESDRLFTRLVQTQPMAHLRDISLSSVPGEMMSTGHPSSRYEHSVGVAHLASRVCERPEFAPFRCELIAAALFHDSGSVAFSHLAEIFQYDATGRTHEQAAEDALADEDVALILDEHEIDPVRVLALINGEHPELGGLLAGTIDLDNLDNSARLLRALGAAKEPPYSPLKLAKAFRYKGGQLSIDSNYMQEIAGWIKCREMLYQGVLYAPDRVSSGTMLYRAIETAYAEGLIDERFFRLGEGAAFAYLRSSVMPKPVHQLLDRAVCWQFYDRVLHVEAADEDTRKRILRLASDWRARKAFADELAETVGVHASFVTVQAGKDKGAKEVKLPFTGRYADVCQAMFQPRPDNYSLQIFLAPDAREGVGAKTAEAAVELLEAVEGVEAGHSFI
jgi:HD superfamily phosphohydrolase